MDSPNSYIGHLKQERADTSKVPVGHTALADVLYSRNELSVMLGITRYYARVLRFLALVYHLTLFVSTTLHSNYFSEMPSRVFWRCDKPIFHSQTILILNYIIIIV